MALRPGGHASLCVAGGLRYPFLFHSRPQRTLSQPVLCHNIYQPCIFVLLQYCGLRDLAATQPSHLELFHIERCDEPSPNSEPAITNWPPAKPAAAVACPTSAAIPAADSTRPLTDIVPFIKSYDDRVSHSLSYFNRVVHVLSVRCCHQMAPPLRIPL